MSRCKLVAYYRVSTARQGKSGLGLEAQQTAVEAHSKATGCAIVASYVEVETGKRADRPELAKALAHAKRAGATLVIAKLDRLARNMAFTAALMDGGVDFVACDNPHATRLTIHILAAVAEDEARRISQRTKDALAMAKARGKVLGGRRESSHTLTAADRARGTAKAAASKRTQAIDAYADLAGDMVAMKAAGKTLRDIAASLNDAGHTTRTGAQWSATTVKRVLDRA